MRPLRERLGFKVVGAWASAQDERFIWLLAYDGEDGFAAADARYYASDERRALDPDPARLLAGTKHVMVTTVA